MRSPRPRASRSPARSRHSPTAPAPTARAPTPRPSTGAPAASTGGQIVAAGTDGSGHPQFNIVGRHRYAEQSSFTLPVAITVRDAGSASDMGDNLATVDDAPLHAVTTPAITPTEGAAFRGVV